MSFFQMYVMVDLLPNSHWLYDEYCQQVYTFCLVKLYAQLENHQDVCGGSEFVLEYVDLCINK